MLLYLAAVFSEGFLVLPVGSSFGGAELGEEIKLIILFDLHHCQLTAGSGLCWLSVRCELKEIPDSPGPGVRTGQRGSCSKEVLRKKSSW